MAYSITSLKTIWRALVLGLALGAGAQALLPASGLTRLFGGRAASLRAADLAAPSLMCTCCAAPVAVGLIECEAGAAAAIIYWRSGLPSAFHLCSCSVMPRRTFCRACARSVSRQHLPGRAATSSWNGPAHFGLAISLVPEYIVIVFALGAFRAWLFPAMSLAIGHAPWLAPALAAAGTSSSS
ncbi:MAG: hypothetical protein ACREFJ_17525 [Acetobacteraceae bacterium]